MINDFCEKNNISKDMLDFKIKYTEIEEFIPELVEQSKIYKFQKYNDCPLFIHVY